MAKRKLSKGVDTLDAAAATTGSQLAVEVEQADVTTTALSAGNPLVAAYRAGRATNEFTWAAQQAVLLPPRLGSPARSAAQRALADLRANIILAVKSANREALRDHVTDLLAKFPACLDSESYCEEMFSCLENLKSLASPSSLACRWEFDNAREKAIEDLTQHVRYDSRQLLKLIPPALEVQEEPAFWLGYYLDQGLRPSSVCDHLLAPRELETASPLPATGWAPSPQPNKGPQLPLADRLVEPGMILPEPSWRLEIIARWVATFGREPESQVRTAIKAITSADMSARCAAVDNLDSAVLIAVQSLENGGLLAKNSPRRKATGNDERDKFIYEKTMAGTLTGSIRFFVNQQHKWSPLESVQGVRQAAIRYAKLHGLPIPPSRRAR